MVSGRIFLYTYQDFRKGNDTHGHQAGDEALKCVGRTMREQVRASDVVGRYGGEEFIIFFSNVTPDTMRRLAGKIRRAVAIETRAIVPVTISIGLARGRYGTMVSRDLWETIKLADTRLYQAKQLGKNRVIDS